MGVHSPPRWALKAGLWGLWAKGILHTGIFCRTRASPFQAAWESPATECSGMFQIQDLELWEYPDTLRGWSPGPEGRHWLEGGWCVWGEWVGVCAPLPGPAIGFEPIPCPPISHRTTDWRGPLRLRPPGGGSGPSGRRVPAAVGPGSPLRRDTACSRGESQGLMGAPVGRGFRTVHAGPGWPWHVSD